MSRPYTLVAELTYRCPLRCGYCSNPLDWASRRDALDAAAWGRVLAEAADLGCVQAHLTGGEPLLRDDLEAIVAAGRAAGLYVNLITSGLPSPRFEALRDAGLDAVQISFQAADPARADAIAGRAAFARKVEAARRAKALGLPLTINVVLHRANLDEVEAIVALAEDLGADRLELANTQWLGWALAHHAALLPDAAQVERARAVARAARARLTGRMEVLFVLPDWIAGRPRACTGGWGRTTLVVTPDGRALPCHAAGALPGEAPRVGTRPLRAIWEDAPLFRRFRGEAWMPEPCRSCDRRAIDFGGCRCQAFLLTGDAAATDPACRLSPHHDRVRDAVRAHGPFRAPHRRGRMAPAGGDP